MKPIQAILQNDEFSKEFEKYDSEIQIDVLRSQKASTLVHSLLRNLLKELFDRELKRLKNMEFQGFEIAVYFVFLVEVMGSLKQYWILQKKLEMSKQLSLKQQQIVDSIYSISFKEIKQSS